MDTAHSILYIYIYTYTHMYISQKKIFSALGETIFNVLNKRQGLGLEKTKPCCFFNTLYIHIYILWIYLRYICVSYINSKAGKGLRNREQVQSPISALG